MRDRTGDSSVPPLIAPAPLLSTPPVPTSNTPAFTVVGPLYVLVPVRTCVPGPFIVNETWPAPSWMVPLKVVTPAGAKVRRWTVDAGDARGHRAAAARAIGQRVDGLAQAVQVQRRAAGKLHGSRGRQAAGALRIDPR